MDEVYAGSVFGAVEKARSSALMRIEINMSNLLLQRDLVWPPSAALLSTVGFQFRINSFELAELEFLA